MREYSKIYPKFWAGADAQRLRNLGSNHLLIALYCMTSQHANMLGIYHLPLYYIAYHTTLSLEVIQRCIQDLSEMGFCQYDKDSEYIWVIDMAYDQVETNLSEKDNRVKYIQNLYESFPDDLPFLEEFYDRYHNHFHLNQRILSHTSKPLRSPFKAPSESLRSPFEPPSKGVESSFDLEKVSHVLKPLQSPFEAPSKPLETPSEPPSKEKDFSENGQKVVINDLNCKKDDQNVSSSEAPSKPLRTPFEAREQEQEKEKEQEQEQEQEKEQEKEKEKEQEKRKNIVAQARRFSQHESSSPIFLIFSHWQKMMDHPNAKLDDKRKSIIRKALKIGYSVDDLKKAISGCAATPYNMGDNPQGQRYDGLHVILRDADQIDRFIANYHKPPRPLTKAQMKTQENLRNGQEWLRMKAAQMTPEERAEIFPEQTFDLEEFFREEPEIADVTGFFGQQSGEENYG